MPIFRSLFRFLIILFSLSSRPFQGTFGQGNAGKEFATVGLSSPAAPAGKRRTTEPHLSPQTLNTQPKIAPKHVDLSWLTYIHAYDLSPGPWYAMLWEY